MRNLKHKLSRALMRHGIIGLFFVATERIVRIASMVRPSVRAALRESEKRAAAFDEQYGVDTSGHIHQTELDIKNPNQLHAVAYGGSDPGAFRDSIGALSIDYRRFVFIDFGSGKGRAILLATEFPFKRIVGIEFAEMLHSIAFENIKHFRSDTSKCKDVTSICMDVVDYPLPNDCLVCYFCNPFDATIMSQILIKIKESFFQNPREIFVVYYNPKLGQLVDSSGIFTRIMTRGPICIWKTISPPHRITD